MRKILVIGGSRFVGRILVEKLLRAGHSITVFNRGRIRSEYPPDINFIKGDRNEGFTVRGHFDSVIDMCAYTGDQTRTALRDLKFDFFLHLGTIAVYEKTEIFPLTERSALGIWPVWGRYNKDKVECERVLDDSRAVYASVRPVYILGVKNYVSREKFIYAKLKRNEPVILPGNGQALVQFVTSHDVAGALALIAEKQLKGVFNCAGGDIVTLKGLVEMMGSISGGKPDIRYNSVADAERHDPAEFPFANEHVLSSNEKIKSLGLEFTPLADGLKRDYELYYKDII